MVTQEPHGPTAPDNLPQVVSRLTKDPRNLSCDYLESSSFAKNGNWSGKAALVISEGKRRLPSRIIHKPIFILKSSMPLIIMLLIRLSQNDCLA